MGLCLGSPAHDTEDTTTSTATPAISSTKIAQYTSSSNAKSPFSEGASKKCLPSKKKERTISVDNSFPGGEILGAPNFKLFSFTDLKAATGNFKSDSVLGEGRFGKVFKGWVDEKTLAPSNSCTGMAVAIKKLNPESWQGFQEWQIVQPEVNFLGRLSHPNLVRLLGYCLEDKELLFVYEFMLKGSLENHLFRRNPNIEPLSWDIRLKIVTGVAWGLAFVHTSGKQVRCGVFKASNILLDGNYNAKISDFGLGKFGPFGGDSRVITGTCSYVAPEYMATGPYLLKNNWSGPSS